MINRIKDFGGTKKGLMGLKSRVDLNEKYGEFFRIRFLWLFLYPKNH